MFIRQKSGLLLTCFIWMVVLPSGLRSESPANANCLFGGGSCTSSSSSSSSTFVSEVLGWNSDLVNDSTLVLLAFSAALALLLTIIVVCCYAKSCPCHGNCERGWKNYWPYYYTFLMLLFLSLPAGNKSIFYDVASRADISFLRSIRFDQSERSELSKYQSNSITRQVTFHRTNIVGKCQMRYFE